MIDSDTERHIGRSSGLGCLATLPARKLLTSAQIILISQKREIIALHEKLNRIRVGHLEELIGG
jgi:hypothetical protein